MRASNCTSHGTCVGNGACQCDVGFTGSNCSACAVSYYGYPTCNCMYSFVFLKINTKFLDCTRESNCSAHGTCVGNGVCQCDVGFTGSNCSACNASYYGYPECNCMYSQFFFFLLFLE